MKAIKMLAIFLLLVGGIALALNWGSLFGGSQSNEGFAETDKIDITEKCTEIRSAWNNVSGWDADIYNAQRKDIDQSKAMGMFSEKGYNTVNNCLIESATNSACDAYMLFLKSQEYSHEKLQKHFKGVEAIKKAENLNNDNRIAQVEKINQLYLKVYNFSRDKHIISPHFNETTTDWTSFATLQNRILTTADSYRNNALYQKELKHLSGFESALDRNNLLSVTGRQKKGFYEGLSQQITGYFDTVEHTQVQVNLYNQIYNNFVGESGEYGIDRIASGFAKFKREVASDNQ